MVNERFDKKLVIFSIVLICLTVIFNIHNFDAFATIVTHNSATTSGPSWFGNVYVQKFTGLPVGQVIKKFGVWTSVNGSGKFFSAPPVGAHTTGLSTILWASKYSASAGSHINDIALDVSATGSGHVRVKLYTDSSGPNTLIAESGSIAVAGTGLQYFPITADFPASGNVWAAFETDTSSMDLFEGTNGNIQAASHTYGTGPTTFGSFLCPSCTQPYIGINYTISSSALRIKAYQDDGSSGNPSTLLGETSPLGITTGKQNFTIPTPITVPASGNVWVGFETNTTSWGPFHGAIVTAEQIIAHTFGLGPSPFGTGICPTCTDEIWSQITYTPATTLTLVPVTGPVGKTITVSGLGYEPTSTITLKWDGSVLSTTPSPITSNSTGGFSGVTFNVPSALVGSHTVNGSDTAGNSTTTSFTVTGSNISLRPVLHDGVTLITSGKLVVTQNGVTIGTGNTNTTGWATVSNVSNGNYNFTVFDDKNFEVYKELNTNVNSNIAKNVSTYDTPFNCISSTIGYQSDLILRINDTDGTHITNITTPTCQSQNIVSFSMTFTGNGQSSTSYSSSMLTTVGSQVYDANPSSFTVSGTTVPTTFTQGNNILSNSFTVGSGLSTTTLNFVITLTKTQSTNAGGASAGQNYFTTNSTCFAGVYDPKSSTCVFGPVNITIPNVTTIITPNQQSNNNIGISCDGTGSVTVTSVNLGNNPLGIALGQLPVTVNCGNPTPTTCPIGTTLTNGVCVAPLTCPIGSQTSNGICVGQLVCPAGTTLQNAQCIAQPTCPVGSVMVNGQCQDNGIPVIIPPTPSPCNVTNPLGCFTQTNQSENVVITATTSDGRVVTSTTTLTNVINPQLNNVSLVIILLIIAAIIGGIIYRYLTRKPKNPSGSRHGKNKRIEDFNKSVRKS